MCQTRLKPYKVAAEGRDRFLEGFAKGLKLYQPTQSNEDSETPVTRRERSNASASKERRVRDVVWDVVVVC